MTTPTPETGTPTSTTPHCYRHPDRETWVSCGRCGKPLCPDCVKHGPVGVRCADCLRGPTFDTALAEPEKVGLAMGVAIALAVLATGGLVWAGIAWQYSTNLLLSSLAGGIIGWTIWRICGRSSNRKTARLALLLGALPPLVAQSVLFIWVMPAVTTYGIRLIAPLLLMLGLRMLAAMLLGAFFAWALTTERHYERNLFDR